MNLIEALKSGKRFKRPCLETWVDSGSKPRDQFYFYREDLIAEDWITEDDKPKLSTWYRPAIFWLPDGEYYKSCEYWFESKEKVASFLKETESSDCVVVEWEERSLPERGHLMGLSPFKGDLSC
jgi:hypothetical protein